MIRVDAIGDFFVWLDSAKEYRNAFPNQKIVLVGNAAWTSCAKVLGYWDEVIDIDLGRLERDMKYSISVVRKMYSLAFETIVNASYSRDLIGDSLLIASGARYRLGSQADLSNVSKRANQFLDLYYTKLAQVDSERKMEIYRNCEIFNVLFDAVSKPNLPVFNPTNIAALNVKLPKQPYILVFPGASWNGKCWPVRNFAIVTQQLYETFGWDVVLGGSDADAELCSELEERLDVPCFNLAGEFSLLDFTELVRNAKILVGNDTSAIHIATAVQTPSVCVLGGGHYGRFAPYPPSLPGIKPVIAEYPMPCFECGWKCTAFGYVKGEIVPCVKNVMVERVYEAALEALDYTNQSPESIEQSNE